MNDHLTGLQKALLWCVLIAPFPSVILAVWCFHGGYTKSGTYLLFAVITVLLLPAALKKPQHPLSMPVSVLGGFHACMLATVILILPWLILQGIVDGGDVSVVFLLVPFVTGAWGAGTALRLFKDCRLMDGSEKAWDRKRILRELGIGTGFKIIGLAAAAFAAVTVLVSILSGRDAMGALVSAAYVVSGLLALYIAMLGITLVTEGRGTLKDDPDQSIDDCLDRAVRYMGQGSHEGDLEARVWLKKALKRADDASVTAGPDAAMYLEKLLPYCVTVVTDLGYPRKAAAFCKEGLRILETASGENNDPEHRALRRFYHENLFRCYGRLGKEEEKAAAGISFLDLLPQGGELSRTDPETLCRLYTTASAVMRENNDCKAAFEYLDQAEALLNDQHEASRRSYMEGLILKEKAAVLKQEGDAAVAETSLMKALSLFGSVTDEVPKNRSRVQAGRICYTLAETRRTEGNFEEALRYYQDALKIFLGRFGEKHHYVADVYLGLADLYAFAGEKEKASRYYQDAAELMKLCSGVDSPDAIRANLVLAGHYKESGSAYKEKECLDDALTGLRESGRSADPVVKEIKERINELAAETGLEG